MHTHPPQPLELMAFKLGGEEYAIPLHVVQDLRYYEAVTRDAATPKGINGIIQLPGMAVPVIDLRTAFKPGRAVYDDFTAVIIINDGKTVLGMVVDSVSDMLTRASAPELPAAARFKSDLQLGVKDAVDRNLHVLDIGKLMAALKSGQMQRRSTDNRSDVPAAMPTTL